MIDIIVLLIALAWITYRFCWVGEFLTFQFKPLLRAEYRKGR